MVQSGVAAAAPTVEMTESAVAWGKSAVSTSTLGYAAATQVRRDRMRFNAARIMERLWVGGLCGCRHDRLGNHDERVVASAPPLVTDPMPLQCWSVLPLRTAAAVPKSCKKSHPVPNR